MTYNFYNLQNQTRDFSERVPFDNEMEAIEHAKFLGAQWSGCKDVKVVDDEGDSQYIQITA